MKTASRLPKSADERKARAVPVLSPFCRGYRSDGSETLGLLSYPNPIIRSPHRPTLEEDEIWRINRVTHSHVRVCGVVVVVSSRRRKAADDRRERGAPSVGPTTPRPSSRMLVGKGPEHGPNLKQSRGHSRSDKSHNRAQVLREPFRCERRSSQGKATPGRSLAAWRAFLFALQPISRRLTLLLAARYRRPASSTIRICDRFGSAGAPLTPDEAAARLSAPEKSQAPADRGSLHILSERKRSSTDYT